MDSNIFQTTQYDTITKTYSPIIQKNRNMAQKLPEYYVPTTCRLHNDHVHRIGQIELLLPAFDVFHPTQQHWDET